MAVCWFVDGAVVSAVELAAEDGICDVDDGDEVLERMRSESPPQPATAEDDEPATSSTLPTTQKHIHCKILIIMMT